MLKEQLNKQRYRAIKILLVKRFIEKVYKLKGFLIQVKIKIVNKGVGLPIVIKQVAYVGLFLLEKVLK